MDLGLCAGVPDPTPGAGRGRGQPGRDPCVPLIEHVLIRSDGPSRSPTLGFEEALVGRVPRGGGSRENPETPVPGLEQPEGCRPGGLVAVATQVTNRFPVCSAAVLPALRSGHRSVFERKGRSTNQALLPRAAPHFTLPGSPPTVPSYLAVHFDTTAGEVRSTSTHPRPWPGNHTAHCPSPAPSPGGKAHGEPEHQPQVPKSGPLGCELCGGGLQTRVLSAQAEPGISCGRSRPGRQQVSQLV